MREEEEVRCEEEERGGRRREGCWTVTACWRRAVSALWGLVRWEVREERDRSWETEERPSNETLAL